MELHTGDAPNWSTNMPSWWKPSDVDVGDEQIVEKANIITTVIRNVGIIVSVIALMFIAIKEMTASVEEKSVIKQAMPGYILGIVMVATVSFIPTIIYNFVKQMQ